MGITLLFSENNNRSINLRFIQKIFAKLYFLPHCPLSTIEVVVGSVFCSYTSLAIAIN